MSDQRITTPCPSCGNRTLFVGSGGHLTCSLIGCKQPVVRDRIAELEGERDRQYDETCEQIKKVASLEAEVERLRCIVGDEDFTSDYQTAGDMRREIDRRTEDAERWKTRHANLREFANIERDSWQGRNADRYWEAKRFADYADRQIEQDAARAAGGEHGDTD